MKLFFTTTAVLIGIGVCLSLAFANPAMLPKHPGYPGGESVSPVTGQPLTSDAGQTNQTGERALQEAAAVDDAHVIQQLRNENDQRILEKPGAGQLPKVQGPQITIQPPVTEATRMPK